jgi:glycerol-3-phosphate dehydrogenase
MVSDSSDSSAMEKVLVLGAGNFGTCLADHLAGMSLDLFFQGIQKSRLISTGKQ